MTTKPRATGIGLVVAVILAACGCGSGGSGTAPTPTLTFTTTTTLTPTASPTQTVSHTASATATAIITSTASATATASHTPSLTPTATQTASPTPTSTATQTSTSTPTVTETATPTTTRTPNTAPVFPVRQIYRTFPGYPIALTAAANDPGSTLLYSSSELPEGAQFDASSALFQWTPNSDQVGAFVLPLTAEDDGVPPLSTSTALGIKVEPLDSCAIPTCDPGSGCVAALPPITTRCCGSGPASPRVPEPDVPCPGGRVVHVGRNADSGFGQLHNCDALQAFNSGQIGVTMRFNIEIRCFDTSTPRQVNTRMTTATRVLFNRAQFVNFRPRSGGGYAERLFLALPVAGPSPFFDLDHAEADLEITVIDADGSTASDRVRVVLQFDSLGDLEETR